MIAHKKRRFPPFNPNAVKDRYVHWEDASFAERLVNQYNNKNMDGFHWQEGTYFKRLEDGSVRIRKMKTALAAETEIDWEITIPQHSWASIVSSVSEKGEDGGRYYEALSFHGEVAEIANPAL